MSNTTEEVKEKNVGYLGEMYQLKLINQLLIPNNIDPETNINFFDEVIELLKPSYFDKDSFKRISLFIIDHYNEFHTQPALDTIYQYTQKEIVDEIEKQKVIETLNNVKRIREGYKNNTIAVDGAFIRKTFITFVKQQQFINLINKNENKLYKGNVSDSELNEYVDNVLSINDIGKKKQYGTSLFENPEKALDVLAREPIGWGIKELDEATNMGIGKGEVCLVLAPQGVGKSSFLTYIANNAYLNGKNVLHILLEGTKEEIFRKHYAKMTGIPIMELPNRKEEVLKRLKQISDKNLYGELTVERLTEGTTVGSLKRWIQVVQERRGIKYNVIVIDYLDELGSDNAIYNKWQGEEDVMRKVESMAVELDVPIYTAVQAKKESNYKRIIEMDDCFGSSAKLKKPQLIISIGRDMEQMKNGRGNLAVIKSRISQSGFVWEDAIIDNNILKIELTNKEAISIDDAMGSQADNQQGNQIENTVQQRVANTNF